MPHWRGDKPLGGYYIFYMNPEIDHLMPDYSLPPAATNQKSRIGSLAIVAGAAFILRIVFYLLSPHRWNFQEALSWDGWGRISLLMAQGHGLSDTFLMTYFPLDGSPVPTAARAPLPILFFSTVIRLFGERLLPIQILQAAFDTATVVIIYYLSRGLYRSNIFGPEVSGENLAHRAGLMAAAGFALWVPEWNHTIGFKSEPIYTFLSTAALGPLLLGTGSGSLLAAGILYGLAALARPAILAIPVLLVVWLLCWRRISFAKALLLPIAAMLVLSPWALRNQRVFGHFIPTQTLLGYDLYRHSGSITRPDYLRWIPPEEGNAYIEQLLTERGLSTKTISEVDLDELLGHEAVKIIISHPGRYLKLCMLRATWLFYDPNEAQTFGPILRLTYCVSVLGLLGLIGWGMWRFPGRWVWHLAPVWITFGYTVVLHAMLVSQFRYTLPLIPPFLIASVYPMMRWFDERRTRSIP